jgi:hypothetical protein
MIQREKRTTNHGKPHPANHGLPSHHYRFAYWSEMQNNGNRRTKLESK